MNKVRHYYVNGHTRVGYFSIIPELTQNLDAVFVLKGLSTKQTNDFLVQLSDEFLNLGEAVDYFHNPGNNELIEGIRVPDKNIAVFSNSTIKKIKADFSEQRVVFLSFAKSMKQNHEKLHDEQIFQLEKEREYQYEKAYQFFADAKEFHARKEEIYLSAMSFKKADAVANKLINTIFLNERRSKKEIGSKENLFFGAATPKGAVHFIEELTTGLKKRYIIKGRSGSGKSTLMRKVGNEALNKGLNITYFLCGFDPSSVDMVIIEELGIAIIDGTSPHVIDPTRETDKVIDMFELCINPKIEDTHMDEINDCEANYKRRMKNGTLHLEKAKNVQVVIDEFMEERFDKELYSKLKQQMIGKIIESSK